MLHFYSLSLARGGDTNFSDADLDEYVEPAQLVAAVAVLADKRQAMKRVGALRRLFRR